MKKILIFFGLLILFFVGFISYDTLFFENIPILDIENEIIDVNKLYIYGTHLNMEGNFNIDKNKDIELILYDGEFLAYSVNVYDDIFNLSEYVNNGVYLDNIPKGNYYMFFRSIDNNNKDESTYKYYALNNISGYQETTYYTMSNYSRKITISNENSYPTMMMKVENIKNKDVYDIVIDPGHGGRDGGAYNNGYEETDFTMKIATKLKEKLENKGLKVKLTHVEGQLSDNEKLEEYGIHGRAVIPGEVKAKYLFSIHLNSSVSASVSGLEVYVANKMNYEMARTLVNNITNLTGLHISTNKINKKEDGIYSRNFTQKDVDDSIKEYIDYKLEPYDITTNSNYYYMIRETGGIVTGAYVDDRNTKIAGNPYVNSNVGTEAYLLELGYISNKNDLSNMINNLDKYVEAISLSIDTLKQ